MSQAPCILVGSCKHHRSDWRYRTDRGGDQVGTDPYGGWQDASEDCGGGGWGWALRMDPPALGRFSRSWGSGRARAFFAFSGPLGGYPLRWPVRW